MHIATFDMLVQFSTDRVFHHILRNVAQIQLVLGLRRLEAQLWQETRADCKAALTSS